MENYTLNKEKANTRDRVSLPRGEMQFGYKKKIKIPIFFSEGLSPQEQIAKAIKHPEQF